MRFFAIYASEMLRGGPTLAADDRAFGAWARLATRAAELEEPAERDGAAWGRIRGAGSWSDRQLLASTCTDQAGVAAAMEAGLVVRDGDDLLVWGYDSAGQKAVESKRKNGAKGGRPKNQPEPAAEPTGNQPVSYRKPEQNLSKTPLLSSPSLSSPSPSNGSTRRRSWTAESQMLEFREAWRRRYEVEPSMGGKHVNGFHSAVVETARVRRVDPGKLFRETLATWLDRPRTAFDARSPYACFCQAWGELLGPAAAEERPVTTQGRFDAAQKALRSAIEAGDEAAITRLGKESRELEAQLEREKGGRR